MTTTVREAPAPLPLQGGLTDPAHPDASNEPVLEIDQIQGNIVPGFNKDHQTYLFLSIDDVDDFKAWLASQVPFISTTAEVLTFNRLFKAIRDRRQVDSSAVKSTWMNIVFSSQGLGTIGTPTDGFDDEAFKDGLAARSLADLLGDPIGDADAPGNPANWVIGGPGDEADVVVIVAADDPEDLTDEIARITGSLMGATLIFEQDGATLPDPLRGHEQFGFLDGVSQPGVRGRVSNDPHDVLTPRQNPNNRDQGKPGQDVLWPGTFVFGYPSQQANPDGENLRLEDPGPLSSAGDGLDWTINGSFLVIRRLRQNVFALHSFLKETATDLSIPDPPTGVAADFVGSRLVGRWRSGAPVMRTPDQDDPDLALDDCANNNFEFQADTPPIPPTGSPSPFDCRDDQFPHSHKDPTGVRCPLTGHIRKVYPRDDESASGGPLPNEVDTQTHRLLRRGLPFGESSPSTPGDPQDDGIEDRGLVFLAYQSSIVNGFEFVTRNWVNQPNFKDPNTGHDPIIGQNNVAGENRERNFIVTEPNNGSAHVVTTQVDWVIPTGGGYFFAPSIDALAMLAS